MISEGIQDELQPLGILVLAAWIPLKGSIGATFYPQFKINFQHQKSEDLWI
jgi:hypothetical protein